MNFRSNSNSELNKKYRDIAIKTENVILIILSSGKVLQINFKNRVETY